MKALILFLLAALMLGLGVWVQLKSQRRQVADRVNRRMAEEFEALAGSAHVPPPVQASAGNRLMLWYWRAGIDLTPGKLLGLGAGTGLAVVVASLAWGVAAGAATATVAFTLAVVLPYWKFSKRREKMIAQIPLLIDQLIRSLNTGRNLDGAFQLATAEAREPLRDVMVRVQNTVDLGGDIVDALHDSARALALNELHYIALAFQMTRSYGSSPKEMLEGLVSLIRQREQASRELRAMTGETRMSAWVLGLLPTAMAFYMMAVNPGYMQGMYNDPSGRIMLLAAVGMQALGGLVLWRMVKNI